MSEYYLNTENINDWVQTLKAGDSVFLTGVIYTARDAAHKRIYQLYQNQMALPFDLCIF